MKIFLTDSAAGRAVDEDDRPAPCENGFMHGLPTPCERRSETIE